MWLDRPSQWDALAGRLLAAGEAGIDSETYGQPPRTSPQHRTRVQCWSVAILGDGRSPRGYRRAFGVVLPRHALDHDELRGALQASTLWGHNAPHDEHSFANEGVPLTVNDTLQWIRVAVPGMRDYGLKDVRKWALGKADREDFRTLMGHRGEVEVDVVRTLRRCECGATPCRKRTTEPGHRRLVLREPAKAMRTKDLLYSVTDMVPGHPLFERWEAYSRADAEDAIEEVDWLRTRGAGATTRPYPWRRHAEKVVALCYAGVPRQSAPHRSGG
jgi:hypothetical protein